MVRVAGPSNDEVRALAAACGTSLHEAAFWCHQSGRRPGRAFSLQEALTNPDFVPGRRFVKLNGLRRTPWARMRGVLGPKDPSFIIHAQGARVFAHGPGLRRAKLPPGSQVLSIYAVLKTGVGA